MQRGTHGAVINAGLERSLQQQAGKGSSIRTIRVSPADVLAERGYRWDAFRKVWSASTSDWEAA